MQHGWTIINRVLHNKQCQVKEDKDNMKDKE